MNGPERKLVHMALILLVIGIVVRFLPWGLPSIETFQVGDSIISSNLEYGDDKKEATDKVIVSEKRSEESFQRKPRVEKSKKANKLPVHVNSASLDELCALKGVGPKLAEKIIAVREASGPFKTPSDLQKVPGIGKKKLQGLLPGVIFD